MSTALFIPKKIKVGFQNRSDTFTGKLAYIIYFDEKNKLRKETSWNGWRDHKIPTLEFDNVPSNFVFNKDVSRYGYFGSGRSVMRVYDHRDFEFEISIDNLTGILMHSDISKRDIVEPCVFAWAGTELVLLPTNSEEYQKSVEYTKKQSENVSAKTLVKGYSYNQKKSEEVLIYLGYFKWWERKSDYNYEYSGRENIFFKDTGKKHIFYNVNTKSIEPKGVGVLSSVCNDEIVDNYADLVDKFFKMQEAWAMVDYKIVPYKKVKDSYYNDYMYKEIDGVILRIWLHDNQDKIDLMSNSCLYNVEKNGDGVSFKLHPDQVKLDKAYRNSYYNRTRDYPELTKTVLADIEKELVQAVPEIKQVRKGYGDSKYEYFNLKMAKQYFMDKGFGSVVVLNENKVEWPEFLG